jgi:D-erythrulose 4-kinase
VSYLVNDPADFADEMIDGFVAAHAGFVRRVGGGVARRSSTRAGEVALVIGGGSGHYPAFAGLVGPGLAHGAAMGNVFASPSAQQVYAVARSVATEAGVLLSYGNYAGDVLNFDRAQERLLAEGIPCRTVTVTDDISSAAEDDAHKRRGVAGDLVVFKTAAWAAEQGRSLDEVWAVADKANARTRTLGVAFSGCTLPGAQEPLFTVPEGRMAVGMGIHGEPGIEDAPMATADELGRLLVDRLLAARPRAVDATRAAVILNGLGSVKAEELFVVYRIVARVLDEAGITPVQPEVGEMVTSFEMAGVSLTVCWLDDELEAAWTAPTATPAYRRGRVEHGEPESLEPATAELGSSTTSTAVTATSESRAVAAHVLAALRSIDRVVTEHVDDLGRLDAIAGDGDHGIGMQRGAAAAMNAAQRAVDDGAGVSGSLLAAGDAWSDRAGGTSGALWGVALGALAHQLGDESVPSARRVAVGVSDAAKAVARVGKARLGDKTMLDAMVPFADDLSRRVEAREPLPKAWLAAADLATTAARGTADLLPRVGRARPHQEKSLGTPDPGAVSFALAVTAVGGTLPECGA